MDNFNGLKSATTVNGVVINIHGDSHKVGKRVRREASLRLPPSNFNVNGNGRTSPGLTASNITASPFKHEVNNGNGAPRPRVLQVRNVCFDF